ncbi:hypothetical protein [Uliginosibacterium sp. H1]|uniref:hypothetical protein n=1 Tax=Uliginosibacterium sp. H1 TaxID=3114757 RepID=UPI002E16DEF5|nr:hypothetical protein [Uliginosibacterium sp. H1]
MSVADDKSYMLDTDLFHWLCQTGLAESGLAGRRLFATHTQLAELRMLKDSGRRAELLEAFEGLLSPEAIEPQGVTSSGDLTESQVLNTSTWLRDDFSFEQNEPAEESQPTYGQLFEALEARERKRHNVQDAVVVETAVKQGATLITADRVIALVVRQWNGSVEEWMLPTGLQIGTQ